MKKFFSLFLSLATALSLGACYADEMVSVAIIGGADGPTSIMVAGPDDDIIYSDSDLAFEPLDEEQIGVIGTADGPTAILTSDIILEEDEYYYDLESVVLYLEYYDTLPDNYITKEEARDLGWEGGSVEYYMDGAAIGGDYFGNREGLLPKEDGRTYTECDLNTEDDDSRGAERLVFSNDGLYFYTDDHYESFVEVWVEDGEVVSEYPLDP